MIAHSEPTYLEKLLESEAVTVFDLEGNALYDDCTKIHCVAWAELESDIPHVTRDLTLASASLKRARVLVGHNIIGYDIPVLKKLGIYQNKDDTILIDTMLLSKLCYPKLFEIDCVARRIPKEMFGRHSLKAWGLRLGCLKSDYEGGFETWNQEMEDYNVQDVRVTIQLLYHFASKEIPERAITTEMNLAVLMRSMEIKGVKFDERGAMELYAKLETIRMRSLDKLQKTFPPVPPECLGIYGGQKKRATRMLAARGWDLEVWPQHMDWLADQGIKFKWSKEVPFNPGSQQQIASRMRELGWIPTKFTDTGVPKMDEPVVIELSELFEEAKPLADYLLSSKRMGQISNPKTGNGWLNRLASDGRIHGRADTMGCISFRFSHSAPNLGQVPSCSNPFGPECRRLFGVDKGNSMVGVDASGLELRFLGHYMAPWDGGAFAKAAAFGRKEDGTDIHTVNQVKAGLPTRDNAKTFIYALIYGAGDAKLGQIVKPKCNNEQTLIKTGKALRARFMRNTPALKMLGEAVRKKATKQKKLIGLDGRILHVRSAHSALNLLLQSAGAIAVKEATVLFHKLMIEAGYTFEQAWWFILHVHDEWQIECHTEIAHDAARIACRSIELAGTQLNLVVPLAGEAAVGITWEETH